MPPDLGQRHNTFAIPYCFKLSVFWKTNVYVLKPWHTGNNAKSLSATLTDTVLWFKFCFFVPNCWDLQKTLEFSFTLHIKIDYIHLHFLSHEALIPSWYISHWGMRTEKLRAASFPCWYRPFQHQNPWDVCLHVHQHKERFFGGRGKN